MTSAPPPSSPSDLIDLIPDPVIGIDEHRLIDIWNRAAVETYGFTREEALGKYPPELFLTRFPIPLFVILELVVNTGHWRGEVVKRTKDGREVTVESRWVARYDSEGRVVGALGIDRPHVEAASASAEQ
jgi:PAS domain S-box-containing protein